MKPLIDSKVIKAKGTITYFSVEEIAKMFKLGRMGKKLLIKRLAERRELSKLRELELKEFINLLKSWLTKMEGEDF